jgi:hypothetical protein
MVVEICLLPLGEISHLCCLEGRTGWKREGGEKNLGAAFAFTHYYGRPTGAFVSTAAYWPCEEEYRACIESIERESARAKERDRESERERGRWVTVFCPSATRSFSHREYIKVETEINSTMTTESIV